MADIEPFLAGLNRNLKILQEREAKYHNNVPLDLLNQISDHQAAIALTEQMIRGELSEANWVEELRPILATGNVTIDSIGEIANSIIAGRDVIIQVTPEKAEGGTPSKRNAETASRQIDDLRELITINVRRLQILKKKEAVYRIDTPPHILIEIQDIEREIKKLQTELTKLEEN